MANQSKKQVSGVRNPDRKNGKAWKNQRKLNKHYNQEKRHEDNVRGMTKYGIMHPGNFVTPWQKAKHLRESIRQVDRNIAANKKAKKVGSKVG